MIGFSAFDAYDMLELTPSGCGDGDQTALTFSLSSEAEVTTLFETAPARGGSGLKELFDTYYGWRMAVLRDPDGNAISLAYAGGT